MLDSFSVAYRFPPGLPGSSTSLVRLRLTTTGTSSCASDVLLSGTVRLPTDSFPFQRLHFVGLTDVVTRSDGRAASASDDDEACITADGSCADGLLKAVARRFGEGLCVVSSSCARLRLVTSLAGAVLSIDRTSSAEESQGCWFLPDILNCEINCSCAGTSATSAFKRTRREIQS